MPVPAAVLGAAVTGGAGLLGQGINAISTGIQNKKMRQWNEKMYGIQRKDALADWAMQNEYNHPSSQMARLREAGLNPMLVYGNGVDGNASGQVRSADVKSYNPNPIQFDLESVAQSSLASFYDVQMRKQVIDNARADNTIKLNQAALQVADLILKGKQSIKMDVDTEANRRKLDLLNQTFDTQIQQAQALLNRTIASTEFTKDANTRANEMQQVKLNNMVADTLLKEAQKAKTEADKQRILQLAEKAKHDTRIAEIEKEWMELGITKNDEYYWRMAAGIATRYINEPGGESGQAGGDLGSGIKKLIPRKHRKR